MGEGVALCAGIRGGAKSPLLCLEVHARNSKAAFELLMIEALIQVYLARLGRLAGIFVISMLVVAAPARAGKIKHPVAVFAGLDKITGRTIAFQAAAGETVQFGSLQI